MQQYTTADVKETTLSLPKKMQLKSKPFVLGKCHEVSMSKDWITLNQLFGDGNTIAAYFVFDENRIESEIVTPVTANDKRTFR